MSACCSAHSCTACRRCHRACKKKGRPVRHRRPTVGMPAHAQPQAQLLLLTCDERGNGVLPFCCQQDAVAIAVSQPLPATCAGLVRCLCCHRVACSVWQVSNQHKHTHRVCLVRSGGPAQAVSPLVLGCRRCCCCPPPDRAAASSLARVRLPTRWVLIPVILWGLPAPDRPRFSRLATSRLKDEDLLSRCSKPAIFNGELKIK